MLQQMCRTCLATCGELVPIFSENYYVHNLPAKLFHTIRIEIQKDDELPQMMCKKCIFLVDSLFCFKDQCEMAEIKLKKSIKGSKSNDANTITDISNYIDENYEKYVLADGHSDALTSSEDEYLVEYASEEARLEVENARRRSRNAKKKRKKNIGVKVKSVEILPAHLSDNSCQNASPVYTNDDNMEVNEELLLSDSDDRSSLYLSEGSKSFKSYSEDKKTYYGPSETMEISSVLKKSKCDEDEETFPLKPVFKRKLDSDGDYTQLSKVPKQVIFKDNGYVDDDIQFIEIKNNESHSMPESSIPKIDGDLNSVINVAKIDQTPKNSLSSKLSSVNVLDDEKNKKFLDSRMKSLVTQLIINIPESCHICSKFFTSYLDALKHKIEFHINLEEDCCCYCPVCQEKFLSNNDILEHLNKHANARAFFCLLCSDSFFPEKNLRNHLYSHMDIQNLQCKICKKKFLRSQGLLNHILEHLVNKPLPCILCTNEFENKDSLQAHINLEHQNPQKELSSNEKEENTNTFVTYPCPYCEQTFSVKTGLRDHVFTHLGVQQYSCLVCEKSFNSQEERTKHMQEHMLPNQKKDCKKFRCRVCHEILISRVAYGEHLKDKHWNSKQTSDILKELSETSMTDKVNDHCTKNSLSLVSNSISST